MKRDDLTAMANDEMHSANLAKKRLAAFEEVLANANTNEKLSTEV